MTTTLILRMIHVLGGVFWAGATFFLVGFVSRAAASGGEDGGRFMERLMTQTRFPVALAIAGAFTILSGLALYWRDSGGFQAAWMASRTGLTFLAGILSLPIGALAAPNGRRLAQISQELRPSGRPPSADQLAEIVLLRRRITRASSAAATLLVVAVLGMSLARYV